MFTLTLFFLRFFLFTYFSKKPPHISQSHLKGMKPRIKNHFRAHQLSIWLRLIPELHRAGMEDVIARHNLFRNHDDMELYEGPVKPDPFGISAGTATSSSSSSSSSSSRLLLIDEQLMMKKGRGLNGSAYLNGILGGKYHDLSTILNVSMPYAVFFQHLAIGCGKQKVNRQLNWLEGANSPEVNS